MQAIAGRLMETRNVETDPPRFARELIGGFTTLCLNFGLDALLGELGLAEDLDGDAHPELQSTLATKLGTKGDFDPRGPRNAKPKQAVDCLFAILGITVVDDADRTITLPGDLRDAMVAALTKVLGRDLGVPKVRDDIISWARQRCDEEHVLAFEKMAAVLDERGMRLTQQPKVPIHAAQAVRANLGLARAHVIARAVSAAIDAAKPILADKNAEAAERLEQPISLKLTPRDVAIQRSVQAQAPAVPEMVAALLADLSELAGLVWIAHERIARPYSPSHTYAVGELIEHPKFGRGTVTAVDIKRVDVEFAATKLALVHARPA